MCAPGTIEAVRRRADAEGIRFDRRTALLAGAGTAASAVFSGQAFAAKKPKLKPKHRLVDLTHVYSENFPLFLGAPVQTTREVVVTVPANGFYAQKWSFWEHSGTHMDAPAHFIDGGRQSPEITLEELIVPIVVIDISARVPADADAVVEQSDLVAFERRHGRIPRGALVAGYSGWETRAGSVAAYRNVGPDGLQHFPRGATAYVGLIPWSRGSGGPCRVVATW